MTKLIQNMPGVIDDEQHKDNDNNITQYFECNKDNILDLAEKHYENLVEELTNNAIDTAANSSNSALPLSQSSPAFPNLPNQTHTYRIEESEIYHNSKGDIAD